MGRKRIGAEPLTATEKQRRYRAREKERLETLKAAPAIDEAALRKRIKRELEKSWALEMKAVRMAEERKRGRELAKKADQNYINGRTVGVCESALYFTGKDRVDIAQHLLHYFMIDREKARASLEADKRTKSLTLEWLDKAGAWGRPPPIMR